MTHSSQLKLKYAFIRLTSSTVLLANSVLILLEGAKVDWDFRISDLVKIPDGTDI